MCNVCYKCVSISVAELENYVYLEQPTPLYANDYGWQFVLYVVLFIYYCEMFLLLTMIIVLLTMEYLAITIS